MPVSRRQSKSRPPARLTSVAPRPMAAVRKQPHAAAADWLNIEHVRVTLQSTQAWAACKTGKHSTAGSTTTTKSPVRTAQGSYVLAGSSCWASRSSSSWSSLPFQAPADEDWVLVEGASEPKSEAAKKAPDTSLLLRLLGDRILDKGDIFVEVRFWRPGALAL